MMNISRTTVVELALLAQANALTSLGPVVEITGYGDTRTLPIGLPIITVGADSAPDVDINLSDAVQYGQDPEALIALALRHPEASIVLAQLLRTTESAPIPEALTIESLAFSTLQSGREFRSWLHHRGIPNMTKQHHAELETVTVTVTAEADVTQVQLTRRSRANALDTATRTRLTAVFNSLAHTDDTIRFTGAGKHFCTGGDLNEFGTFTSPVAAHLVRTTTHLPAAIAAVADRLETHVHGVCVGAGLELAAFSHRVVADPHTTWKLPEVQFGLLPGSGGTVSVPRRIGRHRTLLLCLAPEGITTETALAWGLVDDIVPVAIECDSEPSMISEPKFTSTSESEVGSRPKPRPRPRPPLTS